MSNQEIQAEEGSAGEAQHVASARVARSEARSTLSEEELDARQDALRNVRRRGGPHLDTPPDTGERLTPEIATPSDAPPTDVQAPE